MTIVAAQPAIHGSLYTSRPKVMRRLAASAAVMSLLVVMGTLRTAHASDAPTDEAEFVARINSLRATRGLDPLRSDPELVRGARAWARQMAAAGGISHMPEVNLRNDVREGWCKIGENVGEGPEVGLLHDAFVKSSNHLKNLVDSDFDAVGIGIVYASDGGGGEVIYVAQRFMDSDDVCRRQDLAAAATRVEATLATRVPTQLAMQSAKAVSKAVAKAVTKPKAKAKTSRVTKKTVR